MDKERLRALFEFKESLKSVEEIPIFCDHCRVELKKKLAEIDQAIDAIITKNNGVVL